MKPTGESDDLHFSPDTDQRGGGGCHGLDDWRRDVLCDPQTSGGLLIAAAPEAAATVMATLRDAGFDRARAIGEMRDGPGGVDVWA